MEKPLLGESSGRQDGRLRRRDQSTSRFPRRSDAITHGSPFQKAAALVDLVSFFPSFLESFNFFCALECEC